MILTLKVPIMNIQKGGKAFSPDVAGYVKIKDDLYYYMLSDIVVTKENRPLPVRRLYKGNYILATFLIDDDMSIEEFKQHLPIDEYEKYYREANGYKFVEDNSELSSIERQRNDEIDNYLAEVKSKLDEYKYFIFLENSIL